jgi:hypothetical protein
VEQQRRACDRHKTVSLLRRARTVGQDKHAGWRSPWRWTKGFLMRTAAAVATLLLTLARPGVASEPQYPMTSDPSGFTSPANDGWGARLVSDLAPPPLAGDAAAIAACESGGRLADNTATLGSHDWQARNSSSTASGAFQFIDGTWHWVWEGLIGSAAPARTAADATPRQQLRAFEALWRDGAGAHHWQPSASCWRQMLPAS